MKTLRIFGIALIAIAMGASLLSCNKDNNPTNKENDITGEKKLTRLVSASTDYTFIYTITYDNNGRIQKAIKSYQGKMSDKIITSTDTYKFTWGDEAIVAVIQSESSGHSRIDTETYTLTIEDGLVKHEAADDYSVTYSYNSSNRLQNAVKSGSNYESSYSVIWEKDKLLSISDEHLTTTFTDWTQCNAGYSPILAIKGYEGDIDALAMAHPEIFGIRTKQLPRKEEWSNVNGIIPYTYELNNEGYVSKITEIDEWDELITHTLTWQ